MKKTSAEIAREIAASSWQPTQVHADALTERITAALESARREAIEECAIHLYEQGEIYGNLDFERAADELRRTLAKEGAGDE